MRPVRPIRRFRFDGPALAVWLAGVLVLGIAGCGGGGTSGSPGPSPGPSLSAAEVRLSIVDQLGPRWYCDPDEYPVARGTEQERAIERWPELQAENELMRAIAARLGIDVDGPVSDAGKLAVYRVWKVAVSIPLDPVDAAHWRFDYLAQPIAGATQGVHTTGTIDDHGTIEVDQRSLEGEPPCPICLSVGTMIDTPEGATPVERLRLGDAVWTLDGNGRRIAGTVIALGSTPVPAGHQVVRLVLDDGRTVTASPGHPLPDGRSVGELRLGDAVDGSRVVAVDLITDAGADTYDLVASGPTGTYLAGGIPLASTLRPAPATDPKTSAAFSPPNPNEVDRIRS
jgi:Hint domain-containing protein